jgi:hypothetical protein
MHPKVLVNMFQFYFFVALPPGTVRGVPGAKVAKMRPLVDPDRVVHSIVIGKALIRGKVLIAGRTGNPVKHGHFEVIYVT